MGWFGAGGVTLGGLEIKLACRVATIADITLSGGAPDTLDGIALVAGDRILVKDQSAPAENGIYAVTTLGTGADGTWTRSTDADQTGEVVANSFVWVSEGATHEDQQWVITTDDPIDLGVDAITWTQFGTGGGVTTWAALTDTPGSFTANTIYKANAGGTALVVADLTENGTIVSTTKKINTTGNEFNFGAAQSEGLQHGGVGFVRLKAGGASRLGVSRINAKDGFIDVNGGVEEDIRFTIFASATDIVALRLQGSAGGAVKRLLRLENLNGSVNVGVQTDYNMRDSAAATQTYSQDLVDGRVTTAGSIDGRRRLMVVGNSALIAAHEVNYDTAVDQHTFRNRVDAIIALLDGGTGSLRLPVASGYIELTEGGAPTGNPGAGKGWLYSNNSTPNRPVWEDDLGTGNVLAYLSEINAAHAIGGAQHTASTLASVNALISDGTVVDTGDSRFSDSRTPTGAAGGDLSGTYPNPTISAVGDLELVETKTIASAVTSVTFSGLTGDTDVHYILKGHIRDDSVAAFLDYKLQLNTADPDFNKSLLSATGPTESYSTGTTPFNIMDGADGGGDAYFEARIFAGRQGAPDNAYVMAESIYLDSSTVRKNNVIKGRRALAAQLTTIEIVASSADGIGVDSVISLWKVKP